MHRPSSWDGWRSVVIGPAVVGCAAFWRTDSSGKGALDEAAHPLLLCCFAGLERHPCRSTGGSLAERVPAHGPNFGRLPGNA